jgi:hypothetical protein
MVGRGLEASPSREIWVALRAPAKLAPLSFIELPLADEESPSAGPSFDSLWFRCLCGKLASSPP